MLVLRCEMLHQDKGHSRLGGKMAQQLGEALESACRGSDANDRKHRRGTSV